MCIPKNLYVMHSLQSNYIRQRLLENETLDLQQAFDHARALDLAQQNSAIYGQPSNPVSAATLSVEEITESSSSNKHIASVVKSNCWFCGNWRHARSKCPVREVICHKCGKRDILPSFVNQLILNPQLCHRRQSSHLPQPLAPSHLL